MLSRANLLLGTALLAIAVVLSLVFGDCGHTATSQRTSLTLTAAETSAKECVDSFATLHVELKDAMASPEGMHDRVEPILAKREQLCDQADLAIRTAIDEHVWSENDLEAGEKKVEEHRMWIHTVRHAFEEYEASPTAATLAYLRSLMWN